MIANISHLCCLHLNDVRILSSFGVDSCLLVYRSCLFLVSEVITRGECVNRVVRVIRGVLAQLVLMQRLLDIVRGCASAADLMVAAIRVVVLKISDTS